MTRLDLKAIGEYSQTYSQKICNDFYSDKDTISGGEILNISSVDQVNLFALKALFENWKTTTENFKSPYFDFENEKVKAALKDFMNITSQHIAVKKADFMPILKKATADTIVLTLSPKDYFEETFRELPDFKCTKADLQLLKKYTRINASILDGFAEKLGDEPSVFTNQALNWLTELADSQQNDDADLILQQFNNFVALDKNQFLKDKNTEAVNENEAEQSSFFDSISMPESKPAFAKPEPIIAAELAVKEPVAEDKLKVEEAVTLNDQYQSNHSNLNEHFKGNEANQTLADRHINSPIKNLAGSISLNQKFVFINKLFNGDSAVYNETIEILEKCQSNEEAINLLKYKYAPKYHWNLNSDEADELIDILKRKQ
jgi:hypothetical protein